MLALTYKLYNTKFQLWRGREVIQSYEININRSNKEPCLFPYLSKVLFISCHVVTSVHILS